MLKKLLLIIALVPLTCCFNVFHNIHKNKDGSFDIAWKFTISSALSQMAKQSPASDGGEKEDINTKLKQGIEELKNTYGEYIENITSKEIQDEFDSGVFMSFRIKTPEKIPANKIQSDDLPAIPVFNKKNNTLTFHFTPEETKKDSEKADSEEMETPSNSMGPGPEQLAQMILGSARYQIYLTGDFKPVRAVAKSEGFEIPVQMTEIDSAYLFDFPFMALGSKSNEKPYSLIIQLKD